MAKKTSKVEAHVDQRETFVSIQKSFAETGLSVEEKLKTLYDLQQADTEIDKILQLRGELPLEVERLTEEIEDLTGRDESIVAAMEQIEADKADYKNSIVDYNAQIEKYQAQMENVSNSREYDSLSKEIENLDLLRQIAEKRINEAKEDLFLAKTDLGQVREQIEIRNGDLAAKQAELETIVEATAVQEEKLREVREACAAKIDERTMSAYERIRSSVKNHLAVVPVYNGNACGGCMNTIPPQRLIDIASNRKMIICEHCGRILVGDFK
ncbi:MAG: hypothetical protein HUJ94_08630 [Bacteroidales bacterium]|nr:hypothetical protein [Bacteroidales bacterium]